MQLPRELGRFIQGYYYSEKTQFKQGEHRSLKTEIKLGDRKNFATEFKKGMTPHNKLPIGTERIRNRHNKLRVWVKTAEPNTWKLRAVYVFESINGPLPKGYVVHHKDHDSLNDLPNNLQCMTRREHILEHKKEVHLWQQKGE